MVTDFLQVVSALREQMSANLSRSDVLRPLAWFAGIIAMVTISSFFATSVPSWAQVTIVCLLCASFVLYCGAFLFCLFHDRDALRSEKYSLHKMAIQSGIYGDNLSGALREAPNSIATDNVGPKMAIGSDNV